MRVRTRCGECVGTLLSIALLACARPPIAGAAIPAGNGWDCGALPGGSSICVRTKSECDSLATGCARSDVAYCFTYRGRDEVMHHGCKASADECAQQSARFAEDERDVASCEPSR